MQPTRRLFWLTYGSAATTPSQRLRVRALREPLQREMASAHGINLIQDYAAAPTNWTQAWQMRDQLRNADWVILQKEPVSRLTLSLLRYYTRWLAFDYDDTMTWRVRRDGRCVPSAKRTAALRRIAKAADLMIVGNHVLSDEARQQGADTVIEVPTAVDPINDADPVGLAGLRDGRDATQPLRLGWIGSNANLKYLQQLEPVLLGLQQRGLPMQLHVMAGRPPQWQRFDAMHFSPWSAQAEADFLQQIDVGLMPLADDPHTRGKCAYKALQYMSAARPVVAQDVGVNRAWIGDAGMTVSTPQQWTDALWTLAHEPQRRQQMGLQGRNIVASRFTRPVVASTLASVLVEGLP